jgi:hypothetical protein
MTATASLRRGACRAALAWCCLVPAGACSDGGRDAPAPTAPSSIDLSRTDTPLELSSERYHLQLIGNDLSDDPAFPACSPILVPRGGKFVTTFLWFRWEGDELVGRSQPPYAASLEIRLRRVSSSILGVAVDGTVTGAAPDEYDRFMGKRDTTFAIGADRVILTGTVSPRIRGDVIGPMLGGWLRGPIVFRDASGATSRCTNAHYYLEPARPGGPHDDPTIPPYVPEVSKRLRLEP